MKAMFRGLVRLLVLACAAAAGVPGADASTVTPPAVTPAGTTILEVYVREGCPHCADAKDFLASWAARHPWLRVVYREVDRDAAAAEALIRVSREAGAWPPGVPTFVFGDRVFIGFGTAENMGPVLDALIANARPPPDEVRTPLFGTLRASELGLPLFTLALGLLDGFNPCAMWVLLFLLSLLVHLQDRRRMTLIAGTFVLASGAVYYAFMAAWLNVFLAVGMSTGLRIGLALLALGIGALNLRDFFGEGGSFALSIPASAKPGLYARMRSVLRAEALPASMLAVVALAVVVNFVELLCTAGFPAMYTAVLAQQQLSPAAYYAYLGLYIAGYIVDDALMVTTAVVALSSRRLTERAGRWLKLASGAVMALLGLVLLLRPEWLF
jgi:glutaredoxin